MSRGKTLTGKTRRYRIYVAATNGEPHKIYEFILWVTEHWRKFAEHLGAPVVSEFSGAIGRVSHLFGGELQATQNAFDDWIESKYGVAAETDPHPN